MNTQNQLTTTDGPAGSLALDPRSAPFFPSDNKETIVEVFSQAGDPAFVCGLCGCTNGDMIERIEKDIEDNRDEVLKHGDGRYLFRAHWEPAQVGDEGRIELADYWDLSLVAFLPNAAGVVTAPRNPQHEGR